MKMQTYDNVLVLNMGGIGDLISTMPTMAALKASGSTITSVVWPAQEELARLFPSLDRVVPLPEEWENDPELSLFARALAGKFGYDLVLDFAFMPRAGVLTREARGRRTVGFALEHRRYPWYTDIFPNIPGELRLERNMRLLEQLGLARPQRPDFRIKLPVGTQRRVTSLLESHGIGPRQQPLAIHPGSGNSVRSWPADRFAELADRLAAHTNRPVLLLGGRDATYDGSDETTLTSHVSGLMHTPAIDLGGRLGTAELVDLLGRCSLFVGNNSGPAHLAATLAETPAMLAWAPRNEKVWLPWGEEVALATAEPDCAENCLLNRCSKIRECVEMITVEQMFATYLATIGSPRKIAAAGGSR
jgi:ADP-heptose:LPS heptosyltransferase